MNLGQKLGAVQDLSKRNKPIKTVIQATTLEDYLNPDDLSIKLYVATLHLNLTDFKIYKPAEFSDFLQKRFRGSPSFDQLGDIWLFGPFRKQS
jgi:hypothetical protein